MASVVAATYWPIRALPDRNALPRVTVPLHVQAAELPLPTGPLRLAGAWVLGATDRRFGGISGLAIDGGRFLAVTDRGAVIRFDYPTASRPLVELADLRQGPGAFEKKLARDAESLAADPSGRGWWVGYERNHSLWLYDTGFGQALASIDLPSAGWRDNRGAEGLLAGNDHLLVTAENGRDALQVGAGTVERFELDARAEVADAAHAPDGSHWLLLRTKGLGGFVQSIAPLKKTAAGYGVGPRWQLPKDMFDNFEGMAIEGLEDGGWRFWLISDDGHRIMARTLMVALDRNPVGHGKGPATRAGPSAKPDVK